MLTIFTRRYASNGGVKTRSAGANLDVRPQCHTDLVVDLGGRLLQMLYSPGLSPPTDVSIRLASLIDILT